MLVKNCVFASVPSDYETMERKFGSWLRYGENVKHFSCFSIFGVLFKVCKWELGSGFVSCYSLKSIFHFIMPQISSLIFLLISYKIMFLNFELVWVFCTLSQDRALVVRNNKLLFDNNCLIFIVKLIVDLLSCATVTNAWFLDSVFLQRCCFNH